MITLRTLRALIIEDNSNDADLLLRELREAGYEVMYERVNSEAGVRESLEREWDVILSDYELSDISGLDALEILQETGIDVPFIIISGNIGEEAAASLMRLGADDFLIKGNLSRLVPAIRREMDEAENRREKLKAEQALAQSEERLQLALDAAGLGAWERDLITHDVFWSRETAALLGVSVGGAKFEGLHSQILEEDRPMLQAKYDEAIRTRMPISVRFRIKKRGGEVIWVAESARCEYDENGTPLRLVGTIKDVTRDKLAEDALIEAEERYRVMAETASDAVISIDGQSTILYANPAVAEIFGYKPSELLGKPLTVLMPQAQQAFHLSGIRRYIDSGKKSVDWRRTETTGLRKDGTEIAIQISFGHYRKKDKHYFTGFVRDISEAKAAQEIVRRSQEKYADLINSVEGIVWEADVATLQFTFVSEQAESMLGFPPEAWYEAGFWEKHIHPDDRKWALEFCAASTKDRAPHSFEYRMIHANGSVVWLRDIVTVLVEENEPVTLRGIMVDVTEDRRKDAALKRQALLIEQSNEAIFVWDLEKGIVEWNKGSERLYGYTRDEALGNFGFEMLRSTLPFTREEFVAYLIANGEWTGEVSQTKKDGGQVFVNSRYQLIDLDGRKIVLQTNRDITANRLAEEALRASESRYRHLFENSPYPMIAYDVETFKFLAVNDAAISSYGYSKEEFLSMTLLEIRPPEDIPKVLERVRSNLSKLETSTGAWRHTKKDGTVINVEVTSHALEWEGRPARLVLAHDVTSRLRAEEAVKQSEAKYRELFENANDVIYTHDLEGNFTSLNRTGEYITGYSEAEVLQLNVADIVVPEYLERARQMIRRKVEEGSPPTIYETVVIAKDGRRIPLEINTRLILEDGKPVGIQGIGRDISERLAAQEALRSSEEQLRQAQKLESIGILAGGMAHDFNNMLTAINGYSDLVLRKLSPDDPIRKNVEEIRKAGERSAELTRQLLAFSRRQILQPQALNLNETIEETTSLLRRLIGEDITVTTRLHADLWKVEADPGQLSQVLMNLAINARDAMPKGGSLMIETSNVVLDEKYASRHVEVAPGRYVMFAVSDTGLGMDEETKRRVFEPFFTTKSVGRGTGLGLSTVYGIVKQSGGNIWVYSEPDRGTTFKIYLPEAGAENYGDDLEISQHDLHIGSETILLVEDESSVRGLACEILEACGYTVVEAEDGKEALKRFGQIDSGVDLLITDVVMPNMGGRELSENLLLACPDMKVLFTSGYTDDAILRHGITDENTNFLQKPFTFASLSRKVRLLLDNK